MAGLLMAIMLTLCSSPADAQVPQGIVKEGLTIDSKILGKSVRYTICLPAGYETSQRFYPVVYLLHGYSDNDTGWLQFGEANQILDEGIANRSLPPMILVLPDGGVSFYINNYDNSVRYEDFFIQEFIPYIESKYRIRATKEYRGIAGLSMGGYGALVHTLRHPDMFAACAAFSSGMHTDEEVIKHPDDDWRRVFGPVYGPDFKGRDRITEHFKANSPIHIVQTASADKFKDVRLYIDCGDDDFLYKGNSTFHIVLRDLKIAHEYRVRDGGHTWAYWRTGLPEGLKFIGASFHR
jgi:enterochelin esterase-like enzyme